MFEAMVLYATYVSRTSLGGCAGDDFRGGVLGRL